MLKKDNLLFLIALIVGLGLAYVAVDQAYSTGNAFLRSRAVSCFDSDGGLNYSLAGYTGYVGGSRRLDYCVNDTLVEGWCSSRGGPTLTAYRCSNGCKNGACISASGGDFSQVTFKDGDAFIGQNIDDPDWVWDLDLSSNRIGVENDFV